MKGLFRYLYIFIAASLLWLGGCINSKDAPEEPLQTGAVEFDVEIGQNSDPAADNGVLDDYFIEGRSVIIISQRGTSLSLNFNDYTTDSEGNEIPNENLYKYVYYSNPSADWENYYNFQPYGNNGALDWAYIENDRLNGEYALGALYYPIEYNVYNSVEADQSSYENLLRSNILGAWHKTNAIKTRLRFRFNHLMEAIRVKLLIPDWNPADNSGFGADAVESAAMLGMIKDFDIKWSLGNSTEEPPEAQISEAERCDIKMYLESVNNDVEPINFHDITESFPDEEENVRTATFVVLFPPQQPANNAPAMRFILKTMGGQEKSYVWNTRDMYNLLKTEGGVVNNLILYLPRKANNAILIKAHVVDWVEAESQFTVIPDDVE